MCNSIRGYLDLYSGVCTCADHMLMSDPVHLCAFRAEKSRNGFHLQDTGQEASIYSYIPVFPMQQDKVFIVIGL